MVDKDLPHLPPLRRRKAPPSPAEPKKPANKPSAK